MRTCIYCHRDEDNVASETCPMNAGFDHRFVKISAAVQPVTRDHIKLALSPGYSTMWFKLATGGAEIVVLDRHSTETTRLQVAPPEPGHALRIETKDDVLEIFYEALQGIRGNNGPC